MGYVQEVERQDLGASRKRRRYFDHLWRLAKQKVGCGRHATENKSLPKAKKIDKERRAMLAKNDTSSDTMTEQVHKNSYSHVLGRRE